MGRRYEERANEEVHPCVIKRANYLAVCVSVSLPWAGMIFQSLDCLFLNAQPMVNTKEFNAMPHLVTAGVVTAMAIVIAAPKFVANLIAPNYLMKLACAPRTKCKPVPGLQTSPLFSLLSAIRMGVSSLYSVRSLQGTVGV